MILAILAILSGRQYLRSLQQSRARVPDLVKLTLDRLATQAALHAQDPHASAEVWISVAQLRDDVLRDEFSPGRREELWRRVRAVVESNANVRASVREGRDGEVSRVWEWIGSLGLLEEGFAGSTGGGGRRPSGRLSRGPSAYLSVEGGRGSSSPGSDEKRFSPVGRMQRWDEGRPIY